MLEKITLNERNDLIIAWVAISIAFTLIFVRGGATPEVFLIYLFISLLTVGVGFVLHEMAHKFTAMKFGYWAEFRKDNQMLLVAVVVAALVGVVFAAPGATLIYAPAGLTKEQNGKISAAGPVTNLLLAIPFFLVLVAAAAWEPALIHPSLAALAFQNPAAVILFTLGTVGLTVNSMIALFNMIPVSILDGKKVFAWNVPVFLILIGLSFFMVLFSGNFEGIRNTILAAIIG